MHTIDRDRHTQTPRLIIQTHIPLTGNGLKEFIIAKTQVVRFQDAIMKENRGTQGIEHHYEAGHTGQNLSPNTQTINQLKSKR